MTSGGNLSKGWNRGDLGHLRRFVRGLVVATAWLTLAMTGARAQHDDRPFILSAANLAPVVTPAGDGYLDLLIREMFRRAGLQVEVVLLPTRRGLAHANSGILDGDAGRLMGISNRYPNLVPVPTPVIFVDFLGVFLDDHIRIETREDFDNYRVGYVRGWAIAENFFAGHRDATAVRDPEILFRMLRDKRIDVAFLTRVPAPLYAAKAGVTGLHFSAYSQRRDLFLHLNLRHSDKIAVLNEALIEMQADGTSARILAQYFAESPRFE